MYSGSQEYSSCFVYGTNSVTHRERSFALRTPGIKGTIFWKLFILDFVGYSHAEWRSHFV